MTDPAFEVVKRRAERAAPYFAAPERYLKRLGEVLRERGWRDFRIYLFGSIVEGRAYPGVSDIDVVVVSPEVPESVHERSRIWIEFLRTIGDLAAPFEVHFARPEEFENYYRPLARKFRKIE